MGSLSVATLSESGRAERSRSFLSCKIWRIYNMFVPLPSLTDKKGERMNGVMNHRSGGGFQRIIKKGPSECL